jgi:hypothetical protein
VEKATQEHKLLLKWGEKSVQFYKAEAFLTKLEIARVSFKTLYRGFPSILKLFKQKSFDLNQAAAE